MRIDTRIVLGSTLLLLSACGKWAKADKEQIVAMPVPEYPQVEGDVFGLGSTKKATIYRGSLLIMKNDLPASGLAKVINASSEARQAWADMKKFETETDYVRQFTPTGEVQKQLVLMRQGLQAFETVALQKLPITPEARAENVVTFVEREIAPLNLSAERKAVFDAQWGEYCEAKVIELATHPVIAQNTFKVRPDPAPLCQAYYTAQNYFAGPDCSPTNGDYLRCLWIDGVSKTRWFTSPLEATDEALATERAAKRASLEKIVNETNLAKTRSLLAFETAAFTGSASTAIKNLFINKKESFISIALDQKASSSCVNIIGPVESNELCSVFVASPQSPSPREIIQAVEGSKVNENVFQSLPLAEDRTLTFQEILRYTQERYRAETSELDRLFLQPNGSLSLNQPTYSAAGKDYTDKVSSLRTLMGAELYGAFTPADAASRQTKIQAINDLAQLQRDRRAQWDELQAAITSTTDAGITAANGEGVAHGFLQYVMGFEQFGNILKADFSIKEFENYIFRACLDLQSNKQTDCPASLIDSEQKIVQKANITWPTDGGRIDFSLTISPAQQAGFGPKARAEEGRAPDFFMDLPLEAVEGRTIRFELYRNRLLGYLDIMTGKAFIEGGTAPVYESGISMWEQAE